MSYLSGPGLQGDRYWTRLCRHALGLAPEPWNALWGGALLQPELTCSGRAVDTLVFPTELA